MFYIVKFLFVKVPIFPFFVKFLHQKLRYGENAKCHGPAIKLRYRK